MSGLSKTARASMVGGPSQKETDHFATPELKIAELIKQREAKLFVVRMDFVDALLQEYLAAREEVRNLQQAQCPNPAEHTEIATVKEQLEVATAAANAFKSIAKGELEVSTAKTELIGQLIEEQRGSGQTDLESGTVTEG